jgi:LAO/AO transport system kinase
MSLNLNEIISKALDFDKFSIAKLISIFEDHRSSQNDLRSQIIHQLEKSDSGRQGVVLGITGTPGAGKSTLIGELALQMAQKNSKVSVAVLAIDPSSEVSGGSLLGDRTRVRFPLDEKRLFFRSQASAKNLGGISPTTFQVCRLLYYLFDYVIIETVGIGQNEIDIKNIADHIMLILQPLGGDQIQFMKAGIMEIPDVFVINKCDELNLAKKSYHQLKSSLDFARPDENEIPIYQTSALKNIGIDELIQYIFDLKHQIGTTILDKEPIFLEKWIKEKFGQFGVEKLKEHFKNAKEILKLTGSFDEACNRYLEKINSIIDKE